MKLQPYKWVNTTEAWNKEQMLGQANNIWTNTIIKLRDNIFLCWCCSRCISPPLRRMRGALRKFDAKRHWCSPTDKDALPRSREFIRLDSTYYVGWMYEGQKPTVVQIILVIKCCSTLQKAFDLIDKDYQKTFRVLYNDFQTLCFRISCYRFPGWRF